MTGSLTVTIAKPQQRAGGADERRERHLSASFVRVMVHGTPVYRQVTTGMATSSLTQITSGLTAGEIVVTGSTPTATSATASATSGASSGVIQRRRRLRAARPAALRAAACRRAAAANDRRPRVAAPGVLEPARQPAARRADHPRDRHRRGRGGRAHLHRQRLDKAVENRFNSFGTDTITVETSRFSSNATPLTASDLAAIKATPGVKSTVYSVEHQRHRDGRLDQRHGDDQRHLAADRTRSTT